MRKYPIDSPQAKARIVAAALLADGALDKSEIDILEQGAIVERLGVRQEVFDTVLHAFCDDLQQYGVLNAQGVLTLNRETVVAMLDEIRSPDIRKRLLVAIMEIVNADRRLIGGEESFVMQAFVSWQPEVEVVAAAHRGPVRRWPPKVRRVNGEARA